MTSVSTKLVLNRLVGKKKERQGKTKKGQVLPAEGQKSAASWESEKGICVVAPRKGSRGRAGFPN